MAAFEQDACSSLLKGVMAIVPLPFRVWYGFRCTDHFAWCLVNVTARILALGFIPLASWLSQFRRGHYERLVQFIKEFQICVLANLIHGKGVYCIFPFS